MYWEWPGPHTETAAHVHFQQPDPPQKLTLLTLSFLSQVGTVRGVHLYVFVYLYVMVENKLAKSLMRKKNLSNSETVLTEHLFPGYHTIKNVPSLSIPIIWMGQFKERQIDCIQITVLHCAV